MNTAKHDPEPLRVTREVMMRSLELVPIPAAHVVRDESDWTIDAVNGAYRGTRLGTAATTSPMMAELAGRVGEFLRSDRLRTDFDWTHGETIDCRYYRVTLARTTAASVDSCVVTFQDHTAQVQSERSLRREMATDSLTGLPNREGFGDLLEEVEDWGRAAVLVVDLARFGRVNACLGSLTGDELLITVARRIKGALRASDGLARIGGDEFCILLRVDEGREEAGQVAARIRRSLSAPVRLTDYEISIDCSIGIAFGDEMAGDEPDELIRHAQFAAKRAKETGVAETYQPAAFSIARAQFGLETELRRAIEKERLSLAYQPIRDLGTGRIVAFETLARWHREDGTEIPPSDFIPVAEESGLIVQLGRWSLAEATRTLAAWNRAMDGDCGVAFAVNLSPIQLQRDAVLPIVERALRDSGLPPNQLKLELTESALIADPARTAATLHALKALGTTIALDDFGTGYSNLALLQTLPIDILKIDRSFVTAMLTDRDKVAIVRAILSLAQALAMQTVAEGIESEACAGTLAAMGCTFGQGYFYARPLAPEAAFALLSAPPTSGA